MFIIHLAKLSTFDIWLSLSPISDHLFFPLFIISLLVSVSICQPLSLYLNVSLYKFLFFFSRCLSTFLSLSHTHTFFSLSFYLLAPFFVSLYLYLYPFRNLSFSLSLSLSIHFFLSFFFLSTYHPFSFVSLFYLPYSLLVFSFLLVSLTVSLSTSPSLPYMCMTVWLILVISLNIKALNFMAIFFSLSTVKSSPTIFKIFFQF